MNLIKDAKRILFKAWSVRFAILSGIFSCMELILPYIGVFLPPKTMIVLAIITAFGSAIARIISQPKMHGEQQ
jgi:hypothetical protein